MNIYENMQYIYIICHKKGKDNIIFNVSVSTVLKCVKESTMTMNSTPAMEVDTTSGKTNICKNFINN